MRNELLQNGNDPLALDALISVDTQAFSRELVNDRESSKAPPVEERDRSEVHGQTIIGFAYIRAL